MTDALTDTDYVLDDQVGYVLRLASQRHAAVFQALIPDSITPMQFSALMRLHEHGACSQNQLGRLAGMDVATIKGVVDRLRDKGLVRANPDPEDKRRSVISLSASGARMIAPLQAAGHQITRKTLSPLSEQERKTLLNLLSRLT
jgi:DNA-binding MarR family transcriptional regulator